MKVDLGDELEQVTQTVIGAAYEVSNTLGHGFLEVVYRNALLVELERQGLHAVKEKSFAVHYLGKQVGRYVADIVVGDTVVIELKAVEALAPVHSAQLLNYLKASRLPVGLLLNFGKPRVEVKRVLLRI